MNKEDIKNTSEETLINKIVKINSHLLKDFYLDKEYLDRELIFICKDYLKKKGVLK